MSVTCFTLFEFTDITCKLLVTNYYHANTDFTVMFHGHVCHFSWALNIIEARTKCFPLFDVCSITAQTVLSVYLMVLAVVILGCQLVIHSFEEITTICFSALLVSKVFMLETYMLPHCGFQTLIGSL